MDAIVAVPLTHVEQLWENNGAARRLVTAFADVADLVRVGSSDLPIALDAARRYGKVGHPVRLNSGDCFAYGGAQALRYNGDDLALTDLA